MIEDEAREMMNLNLIYFDYDLNSNGAAGKLWFGFERSSSVLNTIHLRTLSGIPHLSAEVLLISISKCPTHNRLFLSAANLPRRIDCNST